MINNKMSWLILVASVTLLSGCLTRNVVQNVLSSAVPYGANSALYPQRDYSSVDPQRSYSSATQQSHSATPAQRSYSSPSTSCMKNLDMEEMNRNAEKNRIVMDEVKTLCREGKRDKAMKRMMQFGKEMSKSNGGITKEMRECLEKQHPTAYKPMVEEPKDYKKHHVCDSFNNMNE
jgi:hypothetical protein